MRQAFYKLIRIGDCWKKIVTIILRLAWENKTKLCTEAHVATQRVWPVPYACAVPYLTADISRRRNGIYKGKRMNLGTEPLRINFVKCAPPPPGGRYISLIPLTPSTNELLKDGTSGT